MEAGEYGLMRGRVASRAVSSWSQSPGYCRFRGVFWVGRSFFRVIPVTTFSNVYIENSQRRLGEGATTASQSAH